MSDKTERIVHRAYKFAEDKDIEVGRQRAERWC